MRAPDLFRCFLLSCLLFILFSCNKVPPGQFRLEVELEQDLGKTAVLKYLDSLGERTDTATLSDETFLFRGALLGPQLTQLEFPEKNLSIDLFLDNKKMTLSGELAGLTLEGTPLHGEYQQLKTLIAPVTDSLNYYDSLFIVDGLPDYELKSNILREAQKKKIKDFIYRNPRSPVSLTALVKYFSASPSFVEVNGLYGLLDSSLRHSLYGRYFYDEVVKPAKQTDIGMQAPDFRFVNARGDSVSLRDYRGRFVFLDFWASWSLSCLQLNEELKMLTMAYPGKGLEVIQVSMEKNQANWRRTVEEQGLTWTNYSDGLGFKSPIAKQYGVKTLPYNLLIDSTGEILAKNVRGQMLQYQFWRLFGDL